MSYLDLNSYLRSRFGCKVYKLALSSGATCPNRDGRCGTRGCLFCNGAGHFAATGKSVPEQLLAAKALLRRKTSSSCRYIAYFQDYSATYAPIAQLRERFYAAVEDPEVLVLSVATRPDCLSDEVLQLLQELHKLKPVWVELGLQTIHPQTAELIRRGYPLSVFDDAVRRLNEAGLETIVHLILGLPGEKKEMMMQSAAYIGQLPIQGVKLHLLHVLKGTDLAALYRKEPFPLPTLEEYIDLLECCLRVIPKHIVIHRLTGDGEKENLLAPLWSADKKHVLNAIHAAFLRDGLQQGSLLPTPISILETETVQSQ